MGSAECSIGSAQCSVDSGRCSAGRGCAEWIVLIGLCSVLSAGWVVGGAECSVGSGQCSVLSGQCCVRGGVGQPQLSRSCLCTSLRLLPHHPSQSFSKPQLSPANFSFRLIQCYFRTMLDWCPLLENAKATKKGG